MKTFTFLLLMLLSISSFAQSNDPVLEFPDGVDKFISTNFASRPIPAGLITDTIMVYLPSCEGTIVPNQDVYLVTKDTTLYVGTYVIAKYRTYVIMNGGGEEDFELYYKRDYPEKVSTLILKFRDYTYKKVN